MTDRLEAVIRVHIAQLRREAAKAASSTGVKSMTDVTGFGLLGHAHEMAHLGNVDFRLYVESMPWLPGAIAYGKAGAFPGGMSNNQNYFAPWVRFDKDIPILMQDLLWTPETSGGLLIAIPPAAIARFHSIFGGAKIIGEVLPGDGHIDVVNDSI